MEELYVVIGTDGVDRWVCCDLCENEIMSETQAKHTVKELSDYASELANGYTFKVAKLSFLD